jgi:hypothetical protein
VPKSIVNDDETSTLFAHRLFLDLNPLRSTCARCVQQATYVLLAEFDCVHGKSSSSIFLVLTISPTTLHLTEEGMDRLKLWLLDNSNATEAVLLDELRSIQTFAALRPADRIIIYLGAVFNEDAVTAGQIPKHKSVLAALAPTAIQQRHLISAFEWFCGRKYSQLAKYFPVILKQLFDEELVEEDVFFEWAADVTRNEFSAEFSMIDIDTLEHLKASASLFITWLQEAEEEGEEEDDSEEEEEEIA